MELQSHIAKYFTILVEELITSQKKQQILIIASLHVKFWSSAATDHEVAVKIWGKIKKLSKMKIEEETLQEIKRKIFSWEVNIKKVVTYCTN